MRIASFDVESRFEPRVAVHSTEQETETADQVVIDADPGL